MRQNVAISSQILTPIVWHRNFNLIQGNESRLRLKQFSFDLADKSGNLLPHFGALRHVTLFHLAQVFGEHRPNHRTVKASLVSVADAE